MASERTVCLAIDVNEDTDLPRVMEVAARTAAGLVLEGIEVRIYTYEPDQDTEGDR